MKNRVLALGMCIILGSCVSEEGWGAPVVMVSKVIEHPALDETQRGIIEGLASEGFSEARKTISFRFASAQGKMALAAQIASTFAAEKPSAVVGIGTISAQSLAKQARSGLFPLFFSSVTDPKGAGLVGSYGTPSEAITGVSNFIDLKPQILLMRRLQPSLMTLGVVYNPGEANSVAIIKKLKEVCDEQGITLLTQPAVTTADVAQAATKLVQKSDALFVSNDNTALAALASISQCVRKAKKPLYVSDTDTLKSDNAVVAALGPNQFQIGVQTGKMIASYLKGKSVSKLPVAFPLKKELYLNPKAAKQAGLSIPPVFLRLATRLIGG